MTEDWRLPLLDLLCQIYQQLGGDCANLPHNQASETEPYSYPQISGSDPESWTGSMTLIDDLEEQLENLPEGQGLIAPASVTAMLVWIGKVREANP